MPLTGGLPLQPIDAEHAESTEYADCSISRDGVSRHDPNSPFLTAAQDATRDIPRLFPRKGLFGLVALGDLAARGAIRVLSAFRAFRGKGWSVVALASLATTSAAQINPSHRWLSLKTEHFYVHFTRPVEPLARRIAADAERAYAQLSSELHPPRGMIDVVVSDDADFSNGSATPFPTNRIVVYANPPVSETALRYTNDWGQLVITHELTHIFHLDRTRGVWSLAQHVLGRAATVFPNLYDPSWLTEGLAVYEESKLAGAGRIEGSEHRMIARAAALNNTFPSIGAASLGQGRYPFGESAYAYGSLFVDFLAGRAGEGHVRRFVDKSAANVIPYLLDIPAKQSFGKTFTTAWREFSDSVARTIRVETAPPLERWRQLTSEGVYVFAPRWTPDGAIAYSGTPGRETMAAFRLDVDGRRTRLGRRNSRSPNVPLPNGAYLFAQLDFTNPYEQRSDLWIQQGRRQRQITFGQRLASPDVRSDGEIVAEQITPGATRLVRVSPDGKRITPLTSGSYDEQWTEPRWSHSGDYVVASRWLRGNRSQIVVVDTSGRIVHITSSGRSIESAPSWLPNDMGIVYSSDRTGSAQIYVEQFAAPHAFATGRTLRMSDVATGLFEPSAAPSGDRLAAVLFRADGYHLGVGACCAAGAPGEPVAAYVDTVMHQGVGPILSDSGPARGYSPWRMLVPRYWLPTVDAGIRNGYLIGGTTSASDVIGRHTFTAHAAYPTNNVGGLVGDVSYQYSGLGLPILQLDAAQSWLSLGGVSSRDAPQTILGELFRRTWTGDALATWLRQRYRTALSVTGGVGIEQWSHFSKPNGLVPLIDTTGAFGSLTFPSLIAAAGFANYQRPPLSISPEDGVQLNVTLRDRLRSGATASGPPSLSAVGSAALYKSLNLPGFAHHVLALRGAVGWADDNANAYYAVGGVSGNTVEIIPGYTIGEGRKTFPVRGFAAGTLLGTQAATGTVEYRIPLVLFGGGPWSLPLFFDRSMLTLFGDYGFARCPDVQAGRQICNRNGQDRSIDIGSVGAELNVNLGLLSWDTPYRLRFGLVHPTQNGNFFGQPMVQAYFVTGVSF